MENTFKSSVFGGFNRDDVIRYIEKTSLESKQQIEALEQESDGLCRENAELRDKLAAAERERAEAEAAAREAAQTQAQAQAQAQAQVQSATCAAQEAVEAQNTLAEEAAPVDAAEAAETTIGG